MTQSVRFWFDVSCPFAWMTSRWLKEARTVRDIDLEFIPMSLAILNADQDIPADYAKKMEANWGPARVFAKVKTDQPEQVEPLYDVMGKMLHDGGEHSKEGYGAYDPVIAAALEQTGLDASYLDVANDDAATEALQTFHQAAMSIVGEDVGTPVVAIGDAAFFGPVITRKPEGEAAGELFDAAATFSRYPYFFEFKRAKTELPRLNGWD